MVEIQKNIDATKKMTFSPNYIVMIGRVTKYELLTPRELGDIYKKPNPFFLQQKKKGFVNSLIFIFKGLLPGYDGLGKKLRFFFLDRQISGIFKQLYKGSAKLGVWIWQLA